MQAPAMSLSSATHERVPDVLIPHLLATMRMDWHAPPASAGDALNAASIRGGGSPGALQVAARCGAPAFDAVKRCAASNEALSFGMMQLVQGLMVPMYMTEFRKVAARTSIRPERYACFNGLEDMFIRKVAADARDGCHPLIQAARLYLDITFFHPFHDGNARAAMLWHAYQCLRSGHALPDYRRLRAFPFVPGSIACYWHFTALAVQDTMRYECRCD
jgi:hypothetical protein